MDVCLIDSEIVALRGPDVRRFCNGMFTNNARDLAVGACQRTAMLDDRGRIVGLMDLHCLSDHEMIAVLEGMSADAFGERYALYVVLDDVDICPLSWVVRHVTGGEHAPEGSGVVVGRRDRIGQVGFDVLGPEAEVDNAVGAVHGGASARLEQARVAAGLPLFPEDFGPRQLPHEMGMREAFLHFEKGCYVGQETVNRIDVMGGVKRQIASVLCHGNPPGGAEVQFEGKRVGHLTSVTDHADFGVIALSVLRKPHDASGSRLSVAWDDGSCLATVR
jgi:folate-binding protein YgfZ